MPALKYKDPADGVWKTIPSGVGLPGVQGPQGPQGPAGASASLVNDSVTNAYLANMPASTIKGNNTASSADPVDLTVAQVKTLLALVKGDVGLANVDNTSDVAKRDAQVSGTWGTAPLDSTLFGADTLVGDPIYTDSAGKLRSQPQIIAAAAVTDVVGYFPIGTSLLYVGAANVTWPGGAAGLGGGGLLRTDRYSNSAAAQWFSTYNTSPRLWYRNSSSASAWSPWVRLDHPPITVGTVAPTSPAVGDIWVDTT